MPSIIFGGYLINAVSFFISNPPLYAEFNIKTDALAIRTPVF